MINAENNDSQAAIIRVYGKWTTFLGEASLRRVPNYESHGTLFPIAGKWWMISLRSQLWWRNGLRACLFHGSTGKKLSNAIKKTNILDSDPFLSASEKHDLHWASHFDVVFGKQPHVNFRPQMHNDPSTRLLTFVSWALQTPIIVFGGQGVESLMKAMVKECRLNSLDC